MKAGDTVKIDLYLLDSSGYGNRYASAAAFVAAGGVLTYENKGVESTLSYTLTPWDAGDTWEATTAYSLLDRVIPLASPGQFFFVCTTAGTSGGSEPTWDETVGNTTADGTAVWTAYRIEGLHTIAFTAESGDTFINVRPPAGEFSNPDAWRNDFQNYDADSLGATLNSSVATPSVLSAQDVNLGVITAGDSFRSTVLQVPSATATQVHGTTDFSSISLSVALKFAPTDSTSIAIPDSDYTDATERQFRIQWYDDPDPWVAATAYTSGQRVVPTGAANGFYYVSSGGTSAASPEPTWPTTVGATVTDNDITWTAYKSIPQAIKTQLGTGTTVTVFIDCQFSDDGNPETLFTYNKYQIENVWDRNAS